MAPPKKTPIRPDTEDLQTLDASELGKLIGRSTRTVKNDVYRRPETLPPRFIVPGSNRLMWRVVDVRAWMQALADIEAERRAEAVANARRAGVKPDFGYRPFVLSKREEGTNARKRMAQEKQ